MDIRFSVLLVALVFLYVAGMAIFLVWKLFEPKREGETRSLGDFLLKPAAAMAVGVASLGIFMVFPMALVWTIGIAAIVGVVAFLLMPDSQKAAAAKAIANPDQSTQWLGTRLVVATIVVFATIAGLLAIFVT